MIAEVPRVTLLFISMLLLATWPLQGQNDNPSATNPVDSFFANNTRAEQYDDVRPDLVRTFDAARARDLPVASLSTLLHEAAAKRVPPDRVITALEREVERLETARSVVTAAGLGPSTSEQRSMESVLRQVSVHMQAGIDEEVLLRVAEASNSLEQFAETTAALASVASASSVSNESLSRLGRALIGSRLDPSGYGAVSSAYIKGRARGLSPREVTDVVVRILDAGGGIIQIDRELNTRRRR